MVINRDSYSQEEFSRLTVIEETIENKKFDECEFTDCTFVGTRFEKCRFLNCTFTKCDVSNIMPMNSELKEVTFTGCKAIGIDWTKAEKLKELSFTDCLINYSNFRLISLPGLVINKCEAKETDFIEADLSKGNFRKTDFENAIFFKTNLTEADFTGAVNYSIDIKSNTLTNARFSMPEALSLLYSMDIIVE